MDEVEQKMFVNEFASVNKAISELEDAKGTLRRAVEYERHRINNLEANRFPRIEGLVAENRSKIEKTAAAMLLMVEGELPDIKKRVNDLEQRMTDLEDEVKGYHDV